MKQLRLNLTKDKPKPLTKTEVYLKLKYGDKKFKRIDFFKWLSALLSKADDQGFKRGYEVGVTEGYSSGRRDGKSNIRDNY